MFEGQHGRPAHQFGADDDGATTDRPVVQVHQVLQLTGGVHPGGAVSGDEPCGSGPFAGAGGQDDRAGVDPAGAPAAR